MRNLRIRNCNVSLGNMKSLETPIGMLLQIEVLVIFAALLLLFQVVFGSCRRRRNDNTLRFVIFAAYTLSPYILTYTIGLMQDAPFRNELFPIWAMFLMLILGSADSISAYSLEDNEQWRRYNWQIHLKLVWVMVLIGLYFRRSGSSTTKAVVCLALILLHKSDERARALKAPSRQSLERSTKAVANYMKLEHQSRGNSRGEVDVEIVSVDQVPMTGCTYLVLGEEEHLLTYVFEYYAAVLRGLRSLRRLWMEKALPLPLPAPDYRMQLNTNQLVTIKKVWECEGRLLGSSAGGDPDNKLKDKCLSFALFKLLRLRYAGYSLPEKAHEKTWNLIRDGLLSQDDGYKRAFRVVEVELSFLYDFFYTKYGVIFQPDLLDNRMLGFAIFVIGIWATTLFLKHYKRPDSDCRLATLPNGWSVDVLVTSVMIILFIIMELMQYLFMAFSEWAKVIWICEYVERTSWQESVRIERMISTICGVQLLKPWERMLRQYSLLDSYSHKRSRFCNEVMAAYIAQTRDGQKQSPAIKLPKQVKQAVFDALKCQGDWPIKLKNGKASLGENDESKKLLWACQSETATQVIMVWHIATSICEHQPPLGRSASPAARRNFLVATSLSKYLAYLVAFAPRLLPDPANDAEHMFDQVIIEARIFFGECKKPEDRIRALKSGSRGPCLTEESVLKRGARLWNQLVNEIEDDETIWKILAEFWVEMMLYVAPSNDARAHAEHLARGGEFVTHLWALLSHAGIERAPPTPSD